MKRIHGAFHGRLDVSGKLRHIKPFRHFQPGQCVTGGKCGAHVAVPSVVSGHRSMRQITESKPPLTSSEVPVT